MKSPAKSVPITPQRAHEHYFRDCPVNRIDVYRILELFDVTDPVRDEDAGFTQ